MSQDPATETILPDTARLASLGEGHSAALEEGLGQRSREKGPEKKRARKGKGAGQTDGGSKGCRSHQGKHPRLAVIKPASPPVKIPPQPYQPDLGKDKVNLQKLELWLSLSLLPLAYLSQDAAAHGLVTCRMGASRWSAHLRHVVSSRRLSPRRHSSRTWRRWMGDGFKAGLSINVLALCWSAEAFLSGSLTIECVAERRL